MQKYSDKEIELLSLQIGCVIKLERLKKGLSQEDIGLIIGTNSTMIGRIERAETLTSWQNLIRVCDAVGANIKSLFDLKSLEDNLSLVDNCIRYEKKLTTEKQEYYNSLKKIFKKKYQTLK